MKTLTHVRQNVVDQLTAPTLKVGDKVKIDRQVKRAYATKVVTDPLGIRMKIVDATDGKHLTCYRFGDGDWDEDNLIYVARPWILRDSIATRDGIDYTYADSQHRTADNGTYEEDQVIVPAYLEDDEIVVVEIDNTGLLDPDSEPIRYMDVNDAGRAWCREYPT